MSQVLASSLPEKPVLSADGRKLGTIADLTMNVRTGELEHVVIETEDPDRHPEEIRSDENGRLRVSAAAISGAGDQLVVDLSDGD